MQDGLAHLYLVLTVLLAFTDPWHCLYSRWLHTKDAPSWEACPDLCPSHIRYRWHGTYGFINLLGLPYGRKGFAFNWNRLGNERTTYCCGDHSKLPKLAEDKRNQWTAWTEAVCIGLFPQLLLWKPDGLQYVRWSKVASVLSFRECFLVFASSENVLDWVYKTIQLTIKMALVKIIYHKNGIIVDRMC